LLFNRPQGSDYTWPRFAGASPVRFKTAYPAHLTFRMRNFESPPVPKSDEPPQMGSRVIEARHHLYTTNLQNTQPEWSRRSAGDAPTECTSRALPSSASLGVLRLVGGATIIRRGAGELSVPAIWPQGRAAARVPDKPRQAPSRGGLERSPIGRPVV
jgi:hypothetical protein